MELVTGKKGQVHITSADVGALYAEILGTGNYVLSGGDKFNATLISQNTIRIQSGEALMNGRHCRIRYGQYEDVTIESGTIGYRRFDIIGIEYTVNNGIESAELAVIKGTPYTGDIDESHIPSYTEGNILQGDTYAFFPLYLIAYDGLTPAIDSAMFEEHEAQADKIDDIDELVASVKARTAQNEVKLINHESAINILNDDESAPITWDSTYVSNTRNRSISRHGLFVVFDNIITLNPGVSVNTEYTIGTFDTSEFGMSIRNLNLRTPIYNNGGTIIGTMRLTTTNSGAGTIKIYLTSLGTVYVNVSHYIGG